ncbi:hypothetical protein G5B38_09750 [Pseudohalocynthiibacter aestuariivivens]|uniref:Uncharacterized protein n=1 Tax=Roseovarius pelagicus TaxID=2980108 RepID=A0ABY6DB54_9RHOB|nr:MULTISPECIES: hypothetical protein [Rhodobacterales]QIE45784.1 hypothetical protein G5B38_09750 [Pseudohalocynthiibacter aestuariivivens]UXX82258.1 hypothetical protein N7U68_14260 [Roseovarius pelagicus]
MRELIVYSCYVLGGIGCVVSAAVLFDENLFSSLTLFFGSIGVFAIGFICDKLAGIEQALQGDLDTAHSRTTVHLTGDSYLDGENKSFPDSVSQPRFENGMAVVDTPDGPKRFPNMTEAKKFVSERSQ